MNLAKILPIIAMSLAAIFVPLLYLSLTANWWPTDTIQTIRDTPGFFFVIKAMAFLSIPTFLTYLFTMHRPSRRKDSSHSQAGSNTPQP